MRSFQSHIGKKKKKIPLINYYYYYLFYFCFRDARVVKTERVFDVLEWKVRKKKKKGDKRTRT